MGGLLATLTANGLGTLASSIFDGFMDKGEGAIKDIIKDKLGVDIDFNKPLSKKDLELFKHKEEVIRLELDNLKERNRHEEDTLRQELSYAKLDVEDVKSAREANMTYSKSESWLVQNFLPLFSMLLFFMISWSMMYILENNIEGLTATVIMEFDKAIAVMVISFWFGSSYGSKKKDESFDRMMSHKRDQENTPLYGDKTDAYGTPVEYY